MESKLKNKSNVPKKFGWFCKKWWEIFICTQRTTNFANHTALTLTEKFCMILKSLNLDVVRFLDAIDLITFINRKWWESVEKNDYVLRRKRRKNFFFSFYLFFFLLLFAWLLFLSLFSISCDFFFLLSWCVILVEAINRVLLDITRVQ